MSWASRRRSIYLSIVLAVIFVIVAPIVFFVLNKEPTCTDDKQNGDETGIDCGSGYPSDPKTQAFLREYHDVYPHYFRRKWKSYTNMIEKKKQASLNSF